jgi:hypothetical protein
MCKSLNFIQTQVYCLSVKKPKVHKVDASGNLVWSKSLPSGISCGIPPLYVICNLVRITPSDEVFIGGGGIFGVTKYIFQINPVNGSVIWNLFNSPSFGDFLPLGNLEFVIDANEQVKKMKSDGNFLTVYDMPFVDESKRIKLMPDGRIIVLGDHSIVFLDDNLVELDAVNFGGGMKFYNFDFDETGYWIIGETVPFEDKYLYVLDTNLTITNTVALDDESWLTYVVDATPSNVCIAGTVLSSDVNGTSFYLKTYTESGETTNYSVDPDILNIDVGEYIALPIEDSESTCFTGEEDSLFIKDIVIEIKNLGAETLEDVTANRLVFV